MPTILETQLQFQPQFDRATFQSFAELAPEFARVQREALEATSPNLAALDEELAKQALSASQEGLPEELRENFRNTFVSLVGDPRSGIGADFVSKQLLEQDLAFRQAAQNLGLSLQGKVPVTQAFQQPSSFQVANAFQPAFNTAQQGQLGFIQGSRPLLGQRQTTTEGVAEILGGVGGLLQGGSSFFKP